MLRCRRAPRTARRATVGRERRPNHPRNPNHPGHDGAHMTGAADAAGTDEPIIPYLVMRRLRGYFATGVTVVTLQTDDGLRGVTVSSFAVASISPPIVLICL